MISHTEYSIWLWSSIIVILASYVWICIGVIEITFNYLYNRPEVIGWSRCCVLLVSIIFCISIGSLIAFVLFHMAQ